MSLNLALVFALGCCLKAFAVALPALHEQAPFSATPWTPCPDFDSLECRNVTVPYFYDSDTPLLNKHKGNLTNLERRHVRGNPKKHVWLLQGGPSANADILAITVGQVADALGKDVVIQIPYQRGSPHTTTIADYDDYPANLESYLSNQSIPLTVFNTRNVALDIISSIKAAQAKDPSVDHYAIGLSYGCDLLNQILMIDPALFKGVIFDGAGPPLGEGRSVFRSQGLYLRDMARELAKNCEKSSSCKSLPLNQMIEFVDALSQNQSTACFDFAMSTLQMKGALNESFSQLVSILAYQANLPVPRGIFFNETIDFKALIPRALNWVGGNFTDPGLIAWDDRVLLWVLTNHFAQCNADNVESFKELFLKVVQPLFAYKQQLGVALSPMSSVSKIVADHIVFLEDDSPQWTMRDQQSAQMHTLLQSTTAGLEAIDRARAAHLQLGGPAAALQVAATNVSGNVIVVNGQLDPNTPVYIAESFFSAIDTRPGFFKRFFAVPNAGHIVTLSIWNSCSASLLRAYIGQEPEAVAEFDRCLDSESKKLLDWGLLDLQKKSGFDIWQGLSKTGQSD